MRRTARSGSWHRTDLHRQISLAKCPSLGVSHGASASGWPLHDSLVCIRLAIKREGEQGDQRSESRLTRRARQRNLHCESPWKPPNQVAPNKQQAMRKADIISMMQYRAKLSLARSTHRSTPATTSHQRAKSVLARSRCVTW